MFQRFWSWLTGPIQRYLDRRRRQRQIEELRKRDPFIY